MSHRKTPFGWDGRAVHEVLLVVRKILTRTRGHAFSLPAPDDIRWHTTSRSTPWINGTSRQHVWLRKDYDIFNHALGFAKGIVHPGTLRDDERDAIKSRFAKDVWFGKPPPKAKRAPRKKLDLSQQERLAKARAQLWVWEKTVGEREKAVKASTRLLRAGKKRLRALKASVRGLEREIVKAPHDATLPTTDFAETMRAKRSAGLLREVLH